MLPVGSFRDRVMRRKTATRLELYAFFRQQNKNLAHYDSIDVVAYLLARSNSAYASADWHRMISRQFADSDCGG